MQSVVQDMIKICVERRKNEKTYLDCINHEVKDMLKTYLDRIYHEVLDMFKTYLDRIYHEVLDMLKTYLERWNHESKKSARPQSEGVGGKNLSEEDLKILKIYFNGNENNAIKFWKAINRPSKDSDKTDLVNQLVRAGQISHDYKHRPLFRLLKKYGLYGKTEKNWYSRIQ